MAFTLPGAAIPGEATPAVAQPANPGGAPGYYLFTGLEPFIYMQYLAAGSGTLVAEPGEYFNLGVISEASGWPYTLAVPPPDGRWVTEGPEYVFAVFREPGPDYAAQLAAARRVNADLQAARARGVAA